WRASHAAVRSGSCAPAGAPLEISPRAAGPGTPGPGVAQRCVQSVKPMFFPLRAVVVDSPALPNLLRSHGCQVSSPLAGLALVTVSHRAARTMALLPVSKGSLPA